MPNPFAPLLGLVGVAAVGRGSSKRRRKKNKSGANGSSTQRSSSRALDIIRIQRGLSRTDNDSSPQTAGEAAANPQPSPNGHARPADVPPMRISKMLSNDTIGLTTDGKRGYVGAQWWSRYGRSMLTQIRRRHPGATPDEALALLLKQAAPSVDWDAEELPRGALMVSRRLRRLVEAAYMGREADAQPTRPPQSPQEAPQGMPFATVPEDIEGAQTPPVSAGIEMEPETDISEDEDALESGLEDQPPVEAASSELDAQEGTQEPGDRHKTRRGGRRGGKRDRKASAAASAAPEEDARDTPQDGGEPDSGGASGDSVAGEAESPPSQ